ncbi:hypothetical protein BDV23DRAFT_182445 [Aspergillus alliaceus]|uniref:Methyltransferase type 11 domain-containing protein n=1 Tax=Petromyces alliaceus TaxID=209559 RepID=A0A5N7CDI1_PETAA|nr:hypothetical protein BDV23DRAFT_182445 [Aspergillus alliaceus]
MLDNARSQTRADDQSGFHVVDSTKPFNEGMFDLVLAAWLLNYAANKEELLALWQNIFHSLKPGGRFIGVIPSSGILKTPSSARRYYFEGVSAEALECVAEGIRTKLLFTPPSRSPLAVTYWNTGCIKNVRGRLGSAT